MKKGLQIVLIGFLILIVSVSCNLLNTLKSQVQADISSTETTYLMKDDFSNPQSGWEIYSGEYGSAGYSQDGYLVESFLEGEYNWGAAGVNYGNVRIDADAIVLKTAQNGADVYGIDCRLQENGDGYGFRITSDSYAGIFKYENMQSTALVDWFGAADIKTDGSLNRITAICNGSNLQLMVNGVSIAQTTDELYTSGDIAFSVVGFDAGTVSVLFDNLTVQEP